MAERKKINWLLILQGWAMLWVVVGHAGPCNDLADYPWYGLTLYNFAYSFHMALFMFVSGYLFYFTRISEDASKKWPYGKMILEKLERFGIPFVLFTLIGMVIKSVFASQVDRASALTLCEFINAILYPYNGPVREFWFLGALFWMFGLAPLWKITLKNKYIALATFAFLIGFSLVDVGTDFLAIRSACSRMCFFYGGMLLSQYDFSNYAAKAKIPNMTILVLGGVIYVVARIFELPIITPWSAIVFSIALAKILDQYVPQVFCGFRNYTMQIYLMGLWAQMIVKMVTMRFELPWLLGYIVSIALGLYVPVLVSKLLEKTNWKPLLLCVGLKKR